MPRASPPKRRSAPHLTGRFFEHANMGMAVLCLEDPADPGSLRVVAVNEAAKRVAAVPDDVIGKQARDIPEAAQLAVLRDIARVIVENRAVNLGDIAGVFVPERTFLVTVFPIPPNCGGLLFEDVTEQRRGERALRDSEERFRKAFDASPAGMCIFRLEQPILTDVNPRFVELVGYDRADALIGQPLDTLGMWPDPNEYRTVIGRLRASRSIKETSVTYRTYDGVARRAVVSLELIEIEDEERVLGLFWRV